MATGEGAKDFKCEPCADRGRDRKARTFVGDPPTPMCQACALGMSAPGKKGMSAGQIMGNRWARQRKRRPTPVLA